jgi:uncharacterized protein YneR
MRISIDRKALQWFQEELRIKHGASVRFTVRRSIEILIFIPPVYANSFFPNRCFTKKTKIIKAIKWFQEELRIKHGASVRFTVRYGGDSSIQPGYSLGELKFSSLFLQFTQTLFFLIVVLQRRRK